MRPSASSTPTSTAWSTATSSPATSCSPSKATAGVVKVLDFGLAKITSEGAVDDGLTHEGQMLGTPDYIAPEQISNARHADIRADIYSLGCTLYYLLTGKPPFQGDSLYDILQAHHSMDATPLNLVRPEVPVEVAAIVAKMMAKEPGRRFQEPKEVAQSLKPFFRTGNIALAGWEHGNGPARQSAVLEQSAGPKPIAIPDEGPPPTSHDESPEVPWTSLFGADAAGERLAVARVVLRRRPWRWILATLAGGLLLLGLVTAIGTDALEYFESSQVIRPLASGDFRGWKGISREQDADPSVVFRLEGGELVWDSNPGRIFTEGYFNNFSLRFEYQVPANGWSNRGAACLLNFGQSVPYQIDRGGYRVGQVALALTRGGKAKVGDLIPFDLVSGNPIEQVVNRSDDATGREGGWNSGDPVLGARDPVLPEPHQGQSCERGSTDRLPSRVLLLGK